MIEIVCVPLIIAVVYAVIEIYKKIIKSSEKFMRIIPIVGLIVGVVAGVVCYYAFPELILAHNLATAILIGASSGLSATGCNQIFKQLKKYGIDVVEPNNPPSETEPSASSKDKDEKNPPA